MKLIAIVLALASTGPVASVAGHFALDGVAQNTLRYIALERVAKADALTRKIDLHMTTPDGATIRRYDVEITKRLHLIIVSDDFRTFAHVHPTLGRDGHFTLLQRFPKAGSYHVYGDTVPTALPQQVFRFRENGSICYDKIWFRPGVMSFRSLVG